MYKRVALITSQCSAAVTTVPRTLLPPQTKALHPPNTDSHFPSAPPPPVTPHLLSVSASWPRPGTSRGWIRAGCRQGSDTPCPCQNSVPGRGWRDSLVFCSSAPLSVDAGLAVNVGVQASVPSPRSRSLWVCSSRWKCWLSR